MSLSLALGNALAGLKVNQSALSTLSHNIANANTAGYSRQVVNQNATVTAGVGSGVQIGDISRIIDQYLQRSLQNQQSDTGALNIANSYYARLQLFLGQPGANNGIDSAVQSFFNQVQSLAQSPELGSFRASAVAGASALAQKISGLASNIQDLRFQADQEIREAANYINGQLKVLHALNGQISEAFVVKSGISDLLDKRDETLRNLSQYMDISVQTKVTGEVNVSTANGLALIDDDLHQLEYTPVNSAQSFISDTPVNPLYINRIDNFGRVSGSPVILSSGGTNGNVTTALASGRLKGYLDIRDRNFLNVLSQLDTLAAGLRDRVNAVHNNGSSFPPPHVLTGTRLVTANVTTDFSGKALIAVLDKDGKPLASPYPGESSGFRPLQIDFSQLDGGEGEGRPSTQTIINEINAHFAQIGNKVKLGNLDNIRLVSNGEAVAGIPPRINFDFELDNASGKDSDFFVTGVTVKDAGGVTLTTPTSTLPSVSLAATNTFVTTASSSVVTVNTTSTHGFSEGQVVYLPDAGGGPYNGLTSAQLSGYFTISNVTANSFDITSAGTANANTPINIASLSAYPKYDTSVTGTLARTKDAGKFTADVSGNSTSAYYDISVNVGVLEDDGTISTSTVTYRVVNDDSYALNKRYDAVSAAGGGTLVSPTSQAPRARAILVDAEGNELPQTYGSYQSGSGYLKIIGGGADYSIAINELDSKENGNASKTPPFPGTGRGFSHYFELNNFFNSNAPTTTGDTVKNSAFNLAVSALILADPSRISTGRLERSNQPVGGIPRYTYERTVGANETAQAFAALNNDVTEFAAAGGLPAINQNFTGYAGQLIGFNSAIAASAESNLRNSETLLDGFSERLQSTSGVNLDEELANTVVYQNAYSASARIITVTNQLFNDLIGVFG